MPTPNPPRFVSVAAAPDLEPGAELAAGLLAERPFISPKFLYDALGSALFVAITELDEYYPTRTEAQLMASHERAIAAAVRRALPGAFPLVDLGAGNGAKAERLFASLQPASYVAVDIAMDCLRPALLALAERHPSLPMVGVACDFSRRLVLPAATIEGPALVFYPGSSIGNFAPDEAVQLLRQARELARGGTLLIGADLVKPKGILEAAYDDALGVTAAFNLNLLRHANRLLGSDFRPCDWQHVALFNETASRIEMHLRSRIDSWVRWPGHERHFAVGARIHTENSYKWTPESFAALLERAGWRGVDAWFDERRWFGVFFARA